MTLPTRPGWLVVVSAAAAFAIGRVFGLVELYVIGAGLAGALLAALVVVSLRRPVLEVDRWVHPAVLTVGDTGRVDLVIRNAAPGSSPRVELIEPVSPDRTARVSVATLRSGADVTAGYRLPAPRRGIVELGPLELDRRDVLGLVRRRTIAAPMEEVMVAPRTLELTMPVLGHGVLGRHLLAQAQRLGAGEFHSLRDYRPGDEPRTIHWRASARSEELKVRQHTTEGVRRCIVLLDRDGSTYGDDPDGFERAIVAAASLVESSDRAGLTTRFVTAGGIDLRGPDVAITTLRVLAPIDLDGSIGELERDPGDGLGLVVVVTRSPTSPAWRAGEQLVDPSIARVGVFTDGPAHQRVRLSVDASTVEALHDGWTALAGHGGLDARVRLVEHAGATT